MRFIPKKTVHEQIIDGLRKATVGTVGAIVLTAEEFAELWQTPRGPTNYDPLRQWGIKEDGGDLSVAGLPVYQEGEPDCPA